jgi:hypothetical protein
VESLAFEKFQLGERGYWRKATILGDCVTLLCTPNAVVTGRALVDDEFLKSVGASEDDLARYRCDPAFEPPRLLAGTDDGSGGDWDVRRGDVRSLSRDKARSKL